MHDTSVLQWLVPSAVAFAAIAVGVQQYRARNRQQLLIDLQAENAAATAAVAAKVRDGSFPKGLNRWSRRRRRDLFTALCLATVFQRSGRSRSLIYDALASAGETGRYRHANRYRGEIRTIVERTSVTITRSAAYTDLRRARRRLYMLRAAIGLEGDRRLQIERSEVNARSTSLPAPKDRCRDTPDPRLCEHVSGAHLQLCRSAFSWRALEAVVQEFESIVLVGPAKGGSAPVVSLDYHRGARPTSRTQRSERLRLTKVGAQVVLAKYGRPRGLPPAKQAAAKKELADRLAALVVAHPDYSKKDARIVAVPGRYSVELAEQIAKQTNQQRVTMPAARVGNSEGLTQLKVTKCAAIEGKRVILVDDVYRSGRTLQAAAAALLKAGALEVLGLVATCTISPAEPPCGADHH
jgi:Phosphoribosyl transferase domain